MSSLNAPLNATTQITPSSGASSSSAGGKSASSSAFNQINEQAFLKLLTAQLQHQDPTQPVKQSQLAAEMAQFSTATGINTLNGTVSGIASGTKASTLAKAASLVGKQVTTAGNAMVSDGQGDAHGAFSLGGPASQVKVTVANAAGKVVGHKDLGSLGAGTHTFDWSKGSPNQAYQFSVQAATSSGTAVSATPASLYTVSGVQSSGQSVSLSLAGNPNPLALGKVQQVL